MKVKPWPHLHVFKSPSFGTNAKQLWHWHLRAPNGRIIACSGEGFKTKQGCTRSMRTVVADMSIATAIYDAPPASRLVKELRKITG